MTEESNKKVTIRTNGHVYDFVELEAIVGLAIYQQVVSKIREKFTDLKSAVDVIKDIAPSEFCELCVTMLEGVSIDGKACDMISLKRNPEKAFEVIAFAIAANYPDSIPLMAEGEDTGETPSPE